MINYVPDLSIEENEANMIAEVKRLKTGSVTYAVRDTMIDDKEIKCGDYMGIGDKGILAVGTDMAAITLEMIDCMVDDESALISVYYGSDISEEDAEALAEAIGDKYPDVDVELQYGGQPIYYYVISVE